MASWPIGSLVSGGRRSCEPQLLITVQNLAQGLRDKQQIDAVIFDFSKAFDKVSHRHLLLKLEHYGVRGPKLSWIGDFLTNRTQRVMIEGLYLRQLQLHQWFPQALYSALYYLFATLMTYQLAYHLTSVCLPMTACSTGRSSSQLDAVILQEDLNMLQQWEANGLCPLTLTNMRYLE